MGRGDQEQQAIEQLARRFAEETLAPRELDDDRYPFVPWNHGAWSAAAELGLPGLALPERCGGTDQGLALFARVLEIVARWEAGHATVLFTQALARATLLAVDAGAEATRWATLRGDKSETLLGYPIYEDPDELSPNLTATRAEGGFVLDGELAQVSCLPVAAACIVPAQLADTRETMLFVVPTNAVGVRVSSPVVSLGLRACPTADLELAAVQVAASARVGGADAVAIYAQVAERFRPALVALSLGVLRASYELAFAYARERHQAKKRIVQHHMVQDMLAGMAATLDLGTLALDRAGQDGALVAGTELLSLQEIVTTLVTRCTTDGVQVLGGNGYMHDYGQEKHMRDAKQLQVILGASPTRRLRILERRLSRV